MAVRELEPRFEVGPVKLGHKMGKEITPEMGDQCVSEGKNLNGEWTGIYMQVLDENVVKIFRAYDNGSCEELGCLSHHAITDNPYLKGRYAWDFTRKGSGA